MARPKGIPHTEEHKQYMSTIMKEIVRKNMASGKHKIPDTKGVPRRPHTEEHKQLLRAAMLENYANGLIPGGLGYRHTEDAKKRIGEASAGRHKGKPNFSARKVGKLYPEPLYVRVQQGLPVLCFKHGEHTDWKINQRKDCSGFTIRCRPCSLEGNWAGEKARFFYTLAWRCKYLDSDSELTQEFLEQLRDLQNNRCALTGKEFVIGENRRDNKLRPSVDRIDSSIGYKKSNVQLVVWPVNRLKGDFVQSDFIALCGDVYHRSIPEYGIEGC